MNSIREQDPQRSYFYAVNNNFLTQERKVREMKKMEQANNIKIMLTAIVAFLSSLLGVLSSPSILNGSM